jgi:D-3-phosphoglycerate dehydrogenase
MNVLLPRPIEQEAVEMLERGNCAITVAPDPKPETVLPLLKETHGLILRTGITMTSELLAEAGQLQVIARTGGGLDNVDLNAASEKGIIVTSNPGVNTVSVAEHVVSFILALSKQLSVMDRAVRGGKFKIRYRNLPTDISGKTLGLLGFGRIGSELGRMCRRAFHMRVLAHDPYLPLDAKAVYKGKVDFVDIEKLFSQSDVVSIHVPLTESTRDLVGNRELAIMKSDALLINASRGGIVNEAALVDALKGGEIGGAGLDVFSREPVPADHPLLELENVIVTPHTAGLTNECVIRMATGAARCVLDVFTGKMPPNVANPQVLTRDRWRHLAS